MVNKAQKKEDLDDSSDEEEAPGCCLRFCLVLLCLLSLVAATSAVYWVYKIYMAQEQAGTSESGTK